MTSWTEGDGVPLGAVYSIGQDHDGYIWIATDAGLLRFDGVRFTAWDSIGDAPLPKSSASALWVARDGTFWVGFTKGGVRHIRAGRLHAEEQPRGDLPSVTDLIEDGLGTMWAVSDGQLFRLRGQQWERSEVWWNGREPRVLHLFVSRKGELWIGTSGLGGVFRHDGQTGTFQRMAAGSTWGIGEDAAGNMWTTDTTAGFRRLGEVNPPRHAFESSGYRLSHDRQGNLWVATLGDGLWRVRVKTGTAPSIERAALRTGLSSDSVQSLLEDRAGNIWVGTTGGLHRLTERALVPVEDVGFVVDVVPSEAGGALAGTTGGVVKLTTMPGQERTARSALGGPSVRALHTEPDGTLWIGNNNGVWSLTKGVLHGPLSPGPTTPTTVITSAAGGGVWLGYNAWLYRHQNGTVTPLAIPPEYKVNRVTTAESDSAKRLWLAFDQGEIGVVEPDGRFHMLGVAEGLPRGTHATVTDFFEDRDHSIWISGTGGVTRFAAGHATTIDEQGGLPANRVWSVVDDNDGYLWLSVDRGLIRVSREELRDAAAERSHRLRYKLYDTLDGLAGAALGNIRSTRGPDGRLWFVRGGGLTEVDPRHLDHLDASTNVPVRIEAIVANEQRLMPTSQVALQAGTRRLQISYTAVVLTASNRIRFRYRLDGFDTDWVDAGARRQAFYTNLSPGRYRFRVEAKSDDGALGAATTEWDFAILPAFYQSYWFYAASLAMMAAAVGLAWRVRVHRVRREFSLVLAERARLSREIHDTLLQSLVGVALQFDAIASTLDQSVSAARQELVRIRRHIEAYIREARQSIWDLRSPVLETHDLLAALREFGKQASSGAAVRFAATTTGPSRECPAKVENQLLRIGQEAITNAARHARATRINVELRFDETTVVLRVSDNGCGFDYGTQTPEMGAHYGLVTMRERAEELGGRFTVVTGAGCGTVVETVIPSAAT